MRAAASRILAIAGRELVGFFHAPIAYVVLVGFLLLQGLTFWAVLDVLGDPARPGNYGAVLRGQFGGTLLFWTFLFAVISLLSMRLIAEERSSGRFETLLVTPVRDGELVVGKWLGAVVFYCLLWLPTVVYVPIVEAFAAEGTAMDLGPVASAYLGVVLFGAAFLAVGTAASSVGQNQLVAALISFVALFALLMFGELVGGADAIDLRHHMDDFARGAIDSDAVALALAITVAMLALATVLVARGRGSARRARYRLAALALVIIDCALVVAFATAHPLRIDTSSSASNTLEPDTRAVLTNMSGTVQATVIRPEVEQFEPVYDEVTRVLERMDQLSGGRIDTRIIDPVRDAPTITALAAELALSPRDLADAGAIIFERGDRRQGVDLLDLASFGRDALGVGVATELEVEGTLAEALARVLREQTAVVCATSGLGQATMVPLEPPSDLDWLSVADRVRRRGLIVEDIGALVDRVPARCRVLVVAGPATPLSADAALVVRDFLAGGGRLLVAANDRPVDGAGGPELLDTGLEPILAEFGVTLPKAVVVDPGGAIGLDLAWGTATGYGDHPATRAFRNRRLTVWRHPRPVAHVMPADRAELEAEALVRGSPTAWAETDLAALYAGEPVSADPEDGVGLSAIAVAIDDPVSKARLVVLGSVTSPSSQLAGRGAGAADALVAHAIGWLAGDTIEVAAPSKSPEYVRLILSPKSRKALFAFVVVILPLLVAGGAGVWYWRRRRG